MPCKSNFSMSGFSWPAANTPSCLRSGQSSKSSLSDQISFKLSQCTHEMEDQLATKCRCINIFSQADKIYAVLLKEIEGLDEIFEGATEPIKLPYDKGVSWPGIGERFIQPLALKLCSCHDITEILLTSCFL